MRTRTFAWFLDDHHGDGLISVCCKVPRVEMLGFLERDPTRYYIPAYIGPKGWIAMCLDVDPVDWNDVQGLVLGSYRLVAPKKLAALVTDQPLSG